MDRVLQPQAQYAVVYLDDMFIYCCGQEIHLNNVVAILRYLEDTGLMANRAKCKTGKEKTTYLRYMLGKRQVQPFAYQVHTLKA